MVQEGFDPAYGARPLRRAQPSGSFTTERGSLESFHDSAEGGKDERARCLVTTKSTSDYSNNRKPKATLEVKETYRFPSVRCVSAFSLNLKNNGGAKRKCFNV